MSSVGIKADFKNLNRVAEALVPQSKKELRSFLMFYSFYRRFLKEFAKVTAPIHVLASENVPFRWTKRVDKSFKALKRSLASLPIVSFLNTGNHSNFLLIHA